MSHTPGPWVVEDDRKFKNKKLRASGMLMVVAEKGGMPGLIVNQPPVFTKADEANARLIAAAPDLLEALRGTLRLISRLNKGALHPEEVAAVTALRKAEGL